MGSSGPSRATGLVASDHSAHIFSFAPVDSLSAFQVLARSFCIRPAEDQDATQAGGLCFEPLTLLKMLHWLGFHQFVWISPIGETLNCGLQIATRLLNIFR